jgi:hypothetical protein
MDRTVVTVALAFSFSGAAALAWMERPAPEPQAERTQTVVHACPTASPAPAEPLRREAASRVIALTNDWNDEEFSRLRGPHQYGRAGFQAQARFIHEAVGECGEPVFFKENERRTRTRYYAECERGRMEVAPIVDGEGQLMSVLFGAQDVEPGPGVRKAAEGLLRLGRDWDDDFAAHLLAPKLSTERQHKRIENQFDELGRCEIEAVDLAGAAGAVFQLDCEEGQRSMKVSVDEDSRVKLAEFWPIRSKRPG